MVTHGLHLGPLVSWVTMDKETLCSSDIMAGFYEEGCQFF